MSQSLPFLVLFAAAACLPLFAGDYWGLIATRACAYWVLVSGLNLVVGFAGQIAIGWVALLTLGAYTTSVLAAGNVLPALSPYLALAIAAVVGALLGLIIGLPALRLRTFYFAMTTLGFATIITQIALAWQSVTGGGVGIAGPTLTGIFAAHWGLFYFCLGAAVGIRQAGRPRCGELQRPQPAVRLPDQRGGGGCLDLEAFRGVPAQEPGHAARLRAPG